jgi:hypothetical protein
MTDTTTVQVHSHILRTESSEKYIHLTKYYVYEK